VVHESHLLGYRGGVCHSNESKAVVHDEVSAHVFIRFVLGTSQMVWISSCAIRTFPSVSWIRWPQRFLVSIITNNGCVALSSGFDVHPINWAREEPREMSEAWAMDGGTSVGYAVFNRTNGVYRTVNLSDRANLTVTETRKAA
jgi:hypothetical protein